MAESHFQLADDTGHLSPFPRAINRAEKLQVLPDRWSEIPYPPDAINDNPFGVREVKRPRTYNLTEVGLWQHWCQRRGISVKSDYLLSHLLRNPEMIDGCLDLRDAGDILEMGLEVFLRTFGSSTLFFWASFRRFKDGTKRVPTLSLSFTKPVPHELKLEWLHIDRYSIISCGSVMPRYPGAAMPDFFCEEDREEVAKLKLTEAT